MLGRSMTFVIMCLKANMNEEMSDLISTPASPVRKTFYLLAMPNLHRQL